MKKKTTPVTNMKLAQILDLMKQNPHLPVIPMVYSDVVQDDGWAYWMGSWDRADIDQYLVHNGRMFFKDEDDAYDVLERIGYPCSVDEMTNEEIDAAYDSLPWNKAIFVYIKEPEV